MRRARDKQASLRNFALFADACRYGSFTRVAKENYMTVQNVSKAISDMEREAGLKLFERSYHGVSPTAAGRALLPFAEAVLRGVAAWEAKAELLRVVPPSRKMRGGIAASSAAGREDRPGGGAAC